MQVRSKIPIIVLDYFTGLVLVIQVLNVSYHAGMWIFKIFFGGSFYMFHDLLDFFAFLITTTVFVLIVAFVYLPQRATVVWSRTHVVFWMAILVMLGTSSFMVAILMITHDHLVLFWHVSGLTVVAMLLSTAMTWLLRVKGVFVKKPLSVIIKAHLGLILQIMRR